MCRLICSPMARRHPTIPAHCSVATALAASTLQPVVTMTKSTAVPRLTMRKGWGMSLRTPR